MSKKTGLYGLPLPEEPEKPPRKPRWWIRIPLFIAIAVCISLVVLSRIGGSSDTLRTGLEGYLEDSTGLTAHIGTLKNARFYPEQVVDVENIRLFDPEGSAGDSVVTVEKAAIVTGFWSNMAGRSSYRALDIRNVKIAPGIWLPQALEIERAGFVTDDPENPIFVVRGKYDGKPVDMTVLLSSRKTRSGKTEYNLADHAPFEILAGPLSAKGALDLTTGKGLVAKFESLNVKGAHPVTGTVAFLEKLTSRALTGDFMFGESKAAFDLELTEKDGLLTMTGTMTFHALDANGMLGEGGVTDLIQALRAFVLGPDTLAEREKRPYDMRFMDTDVNVVVKSLLVGRRDMGHLEFPVKEQENRVTIGPLAGEIKGGKTEGLIEVDARMVPARMKADINIHGLDYTAFQKGVVAGNGSEGLADVKIETSSEGNSTGALWRGMKGKAMIVAGRGALTDNLVNLWGGGLLNAMLPSAESAEDMTLNCGVADFAIDGTAAKVKTLLLDTNRVTVVGEGSLNFGKGTLNLRLDPESKDVAFLSAGSSVNVTGPWAKPSIRPDTFSLMTRLGALFLGTINPATLAFTLTDLGVSDQHPCQGYMKK